MIQIAALTFNPFQENTYVLWEPSGKCIIVDAGNYSAAEDRALSAFLDDKNLTPIMAVNTHGHVDHMLGVSYVKQTWGVPFALNPADGFLIDSAREHGAIYGFQVGESPKVDIALEGGQTVDLGNVKLQIIHTPGHTPGHICIYEPESRTLLTGDTLFRESIGRTDLPGGDYSWIMRSILDSILPLGGDVAIYPGHGPSSTIGHETLYNPFITEVLQGDVGV